MDLKIDIKLLIYLILGFILATVIGTVSHEYGHYFVAKAYGLDAEIHYGYATWHRPESMPPLTTVKRFWIVFGGPLQTILVGIIGLFLIYKLRASFQNATSLTLKQWVVIFLSLFWLRFSFNFLQSVPRWIQKGKLTGRSDEIRMARFLEWPTWSVTLFFATIGFLVLAFVIYRIVPKKQRLTFILSGLIGGISGFIFWLDWFGKIVMP
ncbi:M50 family metallopeptidase [Flavobacterium terrisoli]|uniref:M50 family metallopeptidase n=1 Tax=Flavobacterium terrisoli TaxID=3242195 RepID=UPI0025428E88|nr:M50 family metallopeptidase [Flavobacterium buctense]